jgi:hypothetical protein
MASADEIAALQQRRKVLGSPYFDIFFVHFHTKN